MIFDLVLGSFSSVSRAIVCDRRRGASQTITMVTLLLWQRALHARDPCLFIVVNIYTAYYQLHTYQLLDVCENQHGEHRNFEMSKYSPT